MLKKHCCTQTSEDSEEKDPPAPEDKNLLKVKKKKIKQATNKHPSIAHPHTLDTYNVHSSTHYPPMNTLSNISVSLSVTVRSCRDFSHLFPQVKPSLQRGGSSASLHNSTMRNTIFQLMIHTLDPLGEGEYMLPTMNNHFLPLEQLLL